MKSITINIQELADRNNITIEEVKKLLATAKRAMKPVTKRIHVKENSTSRWYTVQRRGVGPIKTPEGKFWQFDFLINDDWKKYSVIVMAELDENFMPIFKNKDQLILRTDSGCETGQVFDDSSCECSQQLHLAMKKVEEIGEGIIVYIPHQDGRGMGLPFKLATMWLQNVLQLDTVEAASALAFENIIDARTYSGVICILKFFGVPTVCNINLATNNPKKAEIFSLNGYKVREFEPMIVEPTKDTIRHLVAKQRHLGHLNLVDDDKEGL